MEQNRKVLYVMRQIMIAQHTSQVLNTIIFIYIKNIKKRTILESKEKKATNNYFFQQINSLPMLSIMLLQLKEYFKCLIVFSKLFREKAAKFTPIAPSLKSTTIFCSLNFLMDTHACTANFTSYHNPLPPTVECSQYRGSGKAERTYLPIS